MNAAMVILHGLRLEDGRRWGVAAYPFQRADAEAVLEGDRPMAYLTRARGASKTSDLAGVALAMLLTAAHRARLYWLAADKDQGMLAIDAIAGFCDRSPALREQLTIAASFVEVKANRARLDVLAADAASSWGIRPLAVFCDEITGWSDTAGPRRLWESVSSAAAKRDDARLVVLSTAGDPTHFSRRILDHALTSPLWHVNEVAGPSPWMAADRLAEQKARLLPSSYARLFENQWVASEDRLASPEELRACVTHDGPIEPVPGISYKISLDLGLKRDRTCAVVAHREANRVVVDRLEVWQGSRLRPVKLEDVETWLVEASHRYNHAPVISDPWQAVGLLQRLRAKGVRSEEFAFTAASVGKLASTLFNAIRDVALALPDDADLLDELGHVRLRETSPGVHRMDHASGRHDDRAVALALAVTHLLDQSSSGWTADSLEEFRKHALGLPSRFRKLTAPTSPTPEGFVEETPCTRSDCDFRPDPDNPTLEKCHAPDCEMFSYLEEAS